MPLTYQQRESLLAKLLETPAGRRKVAMTLRNPLRERLDYFGVFRKAVDVEELPPGAAPYADKDIDVPAAVIPEEGELPEIVVRGQRIQIPIKEIAVRPLLSFMQIKERRFLIIQRTVDKARQAIQQVEDTNGFAALSAAALAGPNADVVVNPAPVTRADFIDAYARVEANRLRVARVFMHPLDHADIRKFSNADISPLQQQSLIETGVLETLWGAHVVVSNLVPQGTILVCAEPSTLGVMLVRIPLTVVPADDPASGFLGWRVFEAIGIGVYNSKAVCRIMVTRP